MKKMLLKQTLVALFTLFSVTIWAQANLKGMMKDSKGETLIGASVVVSGSTKGTVTDASGAYSLALGKGAYQVTYSFVGYEAVTKSVTIDNADVTQDIILNEGNTLGEVVISTGSRSVQRTITDSPIPIDVLSANDLKSTGQGTFDKALQYRVPSFNAVNTPVNDATSLLDPYEIRNMGPSRTLILINGKRKNSSSLVYIQTSPGRGESGADISAIPQDAIKRVEILRDGASAQYGSDAIAGVMNIILKDRQDYGTVSLNSGITHKGDGQSLGFSLNNGANIGERGFVNYTVALSNTSLSNRPGIVDASAEADNDLGFGADINVVKAFLKDHPDAGNVNGAPATAAAKFLVNMGLPINKNTEFYANAAYVYKKVNSFANYRTPYWRTTDDGLLHAAGTPYVGYVPTFEGDLNDYNGTVGFKNSNDAGWNTDVSFTVGGNRQIYTVANSRNRGLGKFSPILFKPGGYDFSHKVGNIDITKNLTDALHFAIGTELRSERFQIIAGDTASYKTAPGADSFPGIGENNAGEFTRFNFGGYVDLGYDVSKEFLINATVRTEKYSDESAGKSNYGNQSSFYDKANNKNLLATVWKLSSRYKIGETAVVRASASTGFRAPSLHQINEQIAQASFVPGKGIQTKGIVNNRSSQARLLGVAALKPEKSTNISLGIGLNPSKNFNVTLDYYNIKVKDRIILGSEIGSDGLAPGALKSVLDDNGIVAVSFFTNAINTKTSGLDFVTNYRNILLGSGKLTVNLAGNYQIENKIDGAVQNTDLISKAGKSVFDPTQEALLLTSRPKFKVIFGGDWALSNVTLSLNNTLFGPTTFHQSGIDATLDTRFKPKVVTDLGASINLSKTVNFGVNIQNLLNVMPEWQYIKRSDKSVVGDQTTASLKNTTNLITFNGRYSNVTYDGSHFSQLGLTFAANLTVKF
jgi:iron complex outermembrane recepter protein